MKRLLTAASIAALVALTSACNREGQAREDYRDTTTVQPVTPPPTDTSMLRDTLSDTMRRDTVPSRQP